MKNLSKYVLTIRKTNMGTSDQGGGIVKHDSPPRTTISKFELSYKTIIIYNHQKLSLMDVLQLWNWKKKSMELEKKPHKDW